MRKSLTPPRSLFYCLSSCFSKLGALVRRIGFLVQAEEDTTAAADEMTAKVGSAANSMQHGYFTGLLVGYALDQVGGALLGGLESAVSDAAVNPERIYDPSNAW